MSVEMANFEHLSLLYFHETRAFKAAQFLKDFRNGKTEERVSESIFLKNWKKLPGKDISEARVIREHFVFLMRYYSLLEICCLSRFIPGPSDNDFWSETRESLNLELVRQFYGAEYPLVLVEFLAKRINRELSLEEETADGLDPILLTFLGMIDRAQRNSAISIFLCPLFYGAYCNYGYESLFGIFTEREKCADRILNPSPEPNHDDRFVRGFVDFLIFCGDFDRLLIQSDKHPLLQSAMWSYCADIFQNHGKQLQSVVESLAGVLDDGSLDADDETAARNYSKNVNQLLERLTSGAYGRSFSESLSEQQPAYR